MAAVNFFNENISFDLPDPGGISFWINNIIKAENAELSQLNIIFCSDSYLHQINLEYLQHDTLTDIITFQYATPPFIEGDIFISIDRVRENAANFNTHFLHELKRVIIHGVLHLCGYKDKSKTDQALMRQKEDEALLRYPHSSPN